MDAAKRTQLTDHYRSHLLDDVIPFWEKYGIDHEFGGFLTNLERNGNLYSDDKSVWFQGRATWLFATLYNQVEKKEQWLLAAKKGYDFLLNHCADKNGKLYFSVTRDGKPLQMRRYVFSEVFAVIAAAALAKATGDEAIQKQAVTWFDHLLKALREPGMIAPKIDPNTRPAVSLSPIMCLLSVADAMTAIDDDPRYETIINECIEDLFRLFVRNDEEMVLEHVNPDGSRQDTPSGRVISPGHSIETAWFLMEVGRRRNDMDLVRKSAPIIDWSIERGWDQKYGGILYFVDAENKPSCYLEHDMKLWWPHSEAIYATLLAYDLLGDEKYLRMFDAVHEWTFANFPDKQYGEWFGYLRRDGEVSLDLKGNMWKGPFHIPRGLLLTWKQLERQS